MSLAATCNHRFNGTPECHNCGMTRESIREAIEFLIDHGQDKGYPVVSKDKWQQAFYVQCRMEGQSHNMAEICALQQMPGTSGTDRAFLEGIENQFRGAEWEGDTYRNIAKQAGVDTTGKFYKGTLANYPGDPRAWVADQHDARRVADDYNLQVNGSFTRNRVDGIYDSDA